MEGESTTLSLHYNGDEGYLYVNKTEIYKFKVKDNISWYNFCLGSISKDFTKDEQGQIYLNDTTYDFSVDHSSIKKEDILNIHQYLIIKNNIMFGFIKNIFFRLLASVVSVCSHKKSTLLLLICARCNFKNEKDIVCAKKIIFEILLHVVVKMVNI